MTAIAGQTLQRFQNKDHLIGERAAAGEEACGDDNKHGGGAASH